MIPTLMNGMLTLLLAKFLLNDVPHAAGILANNSGRASFKEELAKSKAKSEREWGEDVYGRKVWAESEWGKVNNGGITLFHGTDRYVLQKILKDRILTSAARSTWDVGDAAEAEEVLPEYIWLSVTPYLAFFFGDVCIKVEVPVSWIEEAGDGFSIDRDIPTSMIKEVKHKEDWV